MFDWRVVRSVILGNALVAVFLAVCTFIGLPVIVEWAAQGPPAYLTPGRARFGLLILGLAAYVVFVLSIARVIRDAPPRKWIDEKDI